MIRPHRDCFNVSVAEKLGWFNAVTWDGELRFEAQMALQTLMEGALVDECTAQLAADRYERGPQRKDQRNGYYRRGLDTEYGAIRDVRVPRSRHSTYQPLLFERYQRRSEAVDQGIVAMFAAGVSTRRVGEILELLCGSSVSAATVSKVAEQLDPLVQQFHQRPLPDHYRYLLLDGVHLRCKAARGRKKVVVLCAYGIRWDGVRELIAFRQAPSESERHWTVFLNDLYERGLKGRHLRLVVTDGAPGLIAAVEMVFPYVPRQRCWFHKMQNVSNKLKKTNRDACVQQAQRIYLAPTRREARKRFRTWQRKWQSVEPKAVDCLACDIDHLLTHFDVPVAHRPTVRTTNPIERSFREVRRRTRPISCFNNPASVDRIVFTVVNHLNGSWEKDPLEPFTQNT